MHPVFYEIFEKLPRVGPGNNEFTKIAYKILASYKGFSQSPKVLDIGCGTGVQTIQLAKLMDGKIIALDNHQAFLNTLKHQSKNEGVSNKIDCLQGDMGAMDFKNESFDLIWAEGSIFILGFERGLKEWHRYLKPAGFMALSEAFWFKPTPPQELKEFWAQLSPGLLDLEGALKVINKSGYSCVGHFRLPETCWIDFYNPIEEELKVFRKKYTNDAQAFEVIEFLGKEIEMYRKYSDYYGYIFFLLQKKE